MGTIFKVTGFLVYFIAGGWGNGLIYRFIKKPWNGLGLIKAVKMAVAHYEINTETEAQTVFG